MPKKQKGGVCPVCVAGATAASATTTGTAITGFVCWFFGGAFDE